MKRSAEVAGLCVSLGSLVLLTGCCCWFAPRQVENRLQSEVIMGFGRTPHCPSLGCQHASRLKPSQGTKVWFRFVAATDLRAARPGDWVVLNVVDTFGDSVDDSLAH